MGAVRECRHIKTRRFAARPMLDDENARTREKGAVEVIYLTRDNGNPMLTCMGDFIDADYVLAPPTVREPKSRRWGMSKAEKKRLKGKPKDWWQVWDLLPNHTDLFVCDTAEFVDTPAIIPEAARLDDE